MAAHLVDRLITKAVRDGLDENRLQIFRRDMVAAVEPGAGLGRTQHLAHAARARTGQHQLRAVDIRQAHAVLGRCCRRAPEAQCIALQRIGRAHALLDRLGHGVQLAVRQHRRRQRVDQALGIVKARIEDQRTALVVAFRRVDGNLHHEAVARGSGDLEGFFALDAVAVGKNQQVREVKLAVEGRHAALGHRAQQQCVHLRPRAVDLVEEEDRQVFAMADQRARLDGRPAGRVDIGVIDEVGRHQIDRALAAREITAEHAREGAQQRRLADAHVALQQHMAAREDSDVDLPDHAALADQRLRNLGLERQCARAPVSQQRVVSIHAATFVRGGVTLPSAGPRSQHVARRKPLAPLRARYSARAWR